MSSSKTDPGRVFEAGLAVLGLLALVAVALATAGPAKAVETHTITVDNGRLTMGYVFLNNKILPADIPGPLDPQETNTSASGTIEVKIDGSTATVADEDFDMPIVWIPDPTAGGAPIPMRFGPQGGLSGTWNSTTGELTLTGALRVDVIWGYDDGGAKICRFDAPNITWTTKPNAISPGIPFNSPQGLDGQGALSAFWTSLPSGQAINGAANCNKPNAVVRDPGAVWLSSGFATVPPAPTCQAEGKDGLWPDCVDPEPWPEPEPEPEPEVNISSVKVVNLGMKAGTKAKLAIKVTNTGDLAASGLAVKLSSSRKTVKVPKQVKLNVAAGKTATVKVTVTATSKAKGKATITARAAGKIGNGTVTVKPARKVRK